MKKLLIALIGVATLCGCDVPKESDGSIKQQDDGCFPVPGGDIVKVKIEGHEYLLFRGAYKGGICHSSSCPCHTTRLDKTER